MDISLDQWEQKARSRQKDNLKLLEKLKARKAREAQARLPGLHEEAFSCINCQKCANCCKTISPRFKTPDIRRIARFLKLKQSVLIDRYLKLDEEGDYVVKSSPCPFLGSDNLCGIYEARPGDCRQYPYTDQDAFIKRTRTTYQNSTTCPAVFYVLERLRESFGNV